MSASGTTLNVYRDWLGIPEGEWSASDAPPDHYTLLRLVRFEDDPEKVRGHYRKLNLHIRGYASGQYATQSQELLNELAKAMLCLTDPDRKREYDESLGREFESKPGERPTMGQWLLREKALTREQLQEAESFAEARGLTLRDAVVQMKLVKPTVAARALAEELGLGVVDLAEMLPDDTVLDQLPRNTVKLHSILPLFIDDETLIVACIHEPSHELGDDLRLRYGVPIRWAITTPLAMNQAIAKYYPPGTREKAEPLKSTGKAAPGRKAAPAARAPHVPFKQLPPEEQQRRKQIGLILMCWGIVGSVLLDIMFIHPTLFRGSGWPFYLTLIVPPATIYGVLKVYWK